MAHFAQLDENNLVVQTIVVSNEVINNLPFPESEPIGVEFCKSLYKGQDTVWKQTSYNSNFRWRYARPGGYYDATNDGFLPPKAHASWVVDPVKKNWTAPVPYPSDGNVYQWDEPSLSWVPKPKPYPSWVPDSTCTQWVPPTPMPYPNMPPFYEWDESTLSWIEAPQS